MQNKIYIASDNDTLQNLKSLLSSEGYNIIGVASNASKVLRDIRTLNIDLILVDNNLPGIKGMELVNIISDLELPIIIISEAWKNELADITKNRFVQSVIIKPLNSANIIPAIETSLANYQELTKLKKEVDSLKEKLDARKAIEKAKGILMENFNFTEEEAFKKIRKQSMDQSKNMKEVAEAIITSSSFFK